MSSSLHRARRTAEIVASYLDLPVVVEDDFQEYNTWDAGWVPDPKSIWDPSPADEELTSGYRRFSERVEAALRRVVAQTAPEGRALIVAHGGTIGTIWRILLGSHTPRFWPQNAALHEVEWRQSARWGANWIFHYFNMADHLPSFMRTS